MDSKITSPIPEPIVQLQRQLDQFRSTRPHRTKLPEPLWEAAVELARQHGLYSVELDNPDEDEPLLENPVMGAEELLRFFRVRQLLQA